MRLKKIAEGRTAEVFSLADGKVVKLYRSGYPTDEAEREAAKCVLARRQDLPTPQVVEVVWMEGRQGIVFDECTGPTMGARLRQHPNDSEPMARLMAEIHVRIHGCSGKGLPLTHERTGRKLERAEALGEVAKLNLQGRLAGIPGAESMCHGDFHPDNVLMSDDGPVIIDWVDATVGPPAADLARSIVLMRYSEPPPEPAEAEIFCEMRTAFLSVYLEQYFALRPLPEASVERWMPIVAGARLSENVACGATENELVTLARTG
jgi:aminoglycoside phosphotransferase (APT) family kinase protein